ncbi:Monogalactosyldiacylglycerol synthase 1, chloroplastic (Partial), partial [Seminavis robusta]|eukprot:Sro3104_g343830.1 Monogalactosyldiacylglycerol synthase 1, chloroplastic (236) ;mRNA; r:2-709
MTIPRYLTAALWLLTAVAAFSPTTTTTRHPLHSVQSSSFKLASAAANEDVCTIQILMSDTGGGHRASANALRDAFDVLHPGKIQCDIVDIFTDYGPFWPFTDYPAIYKIMAEYSFLWDWFYHLGASPFGLAVNEFLMELFCFDSFQECLARPSGSTNHRADMVISVHPLCQDVPLKILSSLDTNGQTRAPSARTTPFVTVVTDLGGAHPTWFNKGVNKCFVPTDALYQCARDRNVQ